MLNSLAARVASPFVVLCAAVITWLRWDRKAFTELVPQGLYDEPTQCVACGCRAADLESVPIGDADYVLCAICRKSVAA